MGCGAASLQPISNTKKQGAKSHSKIQKGKGSRKDAEVGKAQRLFCRGFLCVPGVLARESAWATTNRRGLCAVEEEAADLFHGADVEAVANQSGVGPDLGVFEGAQS